jgi:hypothetical protein
LNYIDITLALTAIAFCITITRSLLMSRAAAAAKVAAAIAAFDDMRIPAADHPGWKRIEDLMYQVGPIKLDSEGGVKVEGVWLINTSQPGAELHKQLNARFREEQRAKAERTLKGFTNQSPNGRGGEQQ